MNFVLIWSWLLLVVVKTINASSIAGNLCWSQPCMHGGTCFGSAHTYICVCPTDYSGSFCEKQLGICQQNPCGNRGLCIERTLTTFECRCYFDYMGPICEEHISKSNHKIWSSLLPVHTRIIFNILQQAYHAKLKRKAITGSDNQDQIDMIDLLSMLTTSKPEQSIIKTDGNEIEQIDQFNTTFSDISPQSTYEVTEQSSPFENPSTITFQSNQSDFMNITEQTNVMVSSTDMPTTENLTTEYFIEQTNSDSPSIVNTTTTTIIESNDFISSNLNITIDNNTVSSSNQTTTTFLNITGQRQQLLDKLCKQLVSHMSSNTSSTNKLLTWFRKHLKSSIKTTSTTTVTNHIQTLSTPLKRIDINDIFYQLNNNNIND